jgi:hypothetical protein
VAVPRSVERLETVEEAALMARAAVAVVGDPGRGVGPSLERALGVGEVVRASTSCCTR